MLCVVGTTNVFVEKREQLLSGYLAISYLELCKPSHFYQYMEISSHFYHTRAVRNALLISV